MTCIQNNVLAVVNGFWCILRHFPVQLHRFLVCKPIFLVR
jgi:hypothetical protein